MHKSLEKEEDGVALAAPQIAIGKRIFVISPEVFNEVEQRKEKSDSVQHTVYINPRITNTSRDREWLDEGCLSIRYLYGKTFRHSRATVEAYDENGKKFKRGASGLLAQIFQHEVDHLNGILFTDHGRDIHEVDPKTMQRLKESP